MVTTRQSAGYYQTIQCKATPVVQKNKKPSTFLVSFKYCTKQGNSLSRGITATTAQPSGPLFYSRFSLLSGPTTPSGNLFYVMNQAFKKTQERQRQTRPVCVVFKVWKTKGCRAKRKNLCFCERSRKKCWKQWKWSASERLYLCALGISLYSTVTKRSSYWDLHTSLVLYCL